MAEFFGLDKVAFSAESKDKTCLPVGGTSFQNDQELQQHQQFQAWRATQDLRPWWQLYEARGFKKTTGMTFEQYLFAMYIRESGKR